jgi:pyochelin biosynthetic protein PchC
VHAFRGGHFYLEHQREAVLDRVAASVRDALPASSTTWPALP